MPRRRRPPRCDLPGLAPSPAVDDRADSPAPAEGQPPLLGAKAALHDAVELTVELIEEGHASAGRQVKRLLSLLAPGTPLPGLVDEVRRQVTAATLGSVRVANRTVEALTDQAIEAATAAALLPWLERPGAPIPIRSDVLGSAPWLADAAIGALNGIAGDHLERQGNGLDLGLVLRHGDRYLAGDDVAAELPFSGPRRRLAVFVHGLATTEWSWAWEAARHHGDPGHHFGALLERDLGMTPIFVRYNTGRRIPASGDLLDQALERRFVAQPVDDILLVGHSMGGLVARSACDQGFRRRHRWVDRLSQVVCLGSPHGGAPLEKLGHLLTAVLAGIDHPATRIPAALLRRRSAGIRDLRHGDLAPTAAVPDGAATGEREVPLLGHVAYGFAAATATHDPQNPLAHVVGDTLVRVPSAAGVGLRRGLATVENACFGGVLHHQLQVHPEVYAWLRRLASRDDGPPPPP